MTDLEAIRREYVQGGLRRRDLPQDPLVLFEKWMGQTKDAKLVDPTAMVVATVDTNGQPFQRIVLLKRFDASGLIFYTNLGSRKAQHLAENQQISLLFPWNVLDRQVAVTGRAEKLSATEAMRYFVTRPKESQIAAWVSQQSNRINTRQVLESKFLELKQKFAKGDIPLPSFWGGYRVVPDSWEFWQGGEHRLHDRFLYQSDEGGWDLQRLAP